MYYHYLSNNIKEIVLHSCSFFKGVAPYLLRDYLLTLLFLKYISDKQISKSHFPINLPKPCNFKTILAAVNNATNNENTIDEALEIITKNNANIFPQKIFKHLQFNSIIPGTSQNESKKHLRDLLIFFERESEFGSNSKYTNKIFISALELLIDKFSSLSPWHQSSPLPPPEVATLMANLVQPQPGDTIYDPSCGSGALLFQCHEQLNFHPQKIFGLSLLGQEDNRSNWFSAQLNIILRNLEKECTVYSGTPIKTPLTNKNSGELQQFDIAVSCPPLSLPKWDWQIAKRDNHNRFVNGIPPRTKGNYSFILHMLASLKTHGRMAVVMPNGVLFRGATEKAIRKSLIQENLLHTIISLPGKLFYRIKHSLVIMVFHKHKQDNKILFIDARNLYQAGRSRNIFSKNNLAKIIAHYSNRHRISHYTHLATPKEIAQNDYNLNISLYIRHDRCNHQAKHINNNTNLNKLLHERAQILDEIKQANQHTDSQLTDLLTINQR